MSLPKFDQPLFETELPSTQEKVKYRPFTVKEEKILLIAQQSEDIEQTILSLKQIINNCVEGVDVEKMPLFDLEYLLITLRSKSVNNILDFSVKDPDTEEIVELNLNLNEITVSRTEGHTNRIDISENAFIFMRYPNVNELKDILKTPDNDEALFKTLFGCMEKLVYEDSVYLFAEYTQEELDDFVDGLSGDVLKQIKGFFETSPKIKHQFKYTNKEGVDKVFVLEGLDSFFI